MSRPRTIDPFRVRALIAEGLTPTEVARELGCSRPTVYAALREARELERDYRNVDPKDLPQLRPFFPPGDFTPTTKCDCDRRPIRAGELWYCVVCHKSGLDYLPHFKGVKPLPRDPDQGPETQGPKLTRKQRRALQRRRSEAERARRIERFSQMAARNEPAPRAAKATA